MFDGIFPRASHDFLYKNILPGFLLLISSTQERVHYCCRQSEVNSQIRFTHWCVYRGIEETTFHLSLYIYRLKTIRERQIVDWRNLRDRNETQMIALNSTFDLFVGMNFIYQEIEVLKSKFTS